MINFLDFTALSFQFIGAIISFIYSAKNKPEGTFIYSGNPDYNTPKKREFRGNIGFILMAIGFLIQFFILIKKVNACN